MPVISSGNLEIDYSDDGHGPPVVLIHSSVSGNRQWRALTEALTDRYRVLAPNMYGYGGTTPWPAAAPQSLFAQAQIVLAVCEQLGEPVHLVGHSFGGTVALKAATLLGPRVGRMVLLEPNPIYLLEQEGRTAAYLEARDLRDYVKCFGALGEWDRVAERFADYWIGDGAWDAMPEKRRAAFVEASAAQLPRVGRGYGRADDRRAVPGPHLSHAGRQRRLDATADPGDRRDPRGRVPAVVVPHDRRGRPHGAAHPAGRDQSDGAGVPGRLVERRREPLANRHRERIDVAELGERPDHHATDAVARVAAGLGDGVEQRTQACLVLAARERLEAQPRHGRSVRIGRELAARQQSVGLAVVLHRLEQLERLGLPPVGEQDAGELDAHVGARRVELDRLAQRLLVARLEQRVGGLGLRGSRRSARRRPAAVLR